MTKAIEKQKSIFAIPSKFFGALSQRMAPPSGGSVLAPVLDENRLRGRDITGIQHLSHGEIALIVDVALKLKANKFDETQTLFAKGQTLAMLFEKPSLRTRVTFEAGMTQLGGHAIYLEGKLGVREPILDVAKNLERWVDGIMARTFRHDTILELANNANVPVINGLSDKEHPCQALADFMTILEHKAIADSVTAVPTHPNAKAYKGLKLAFIGDGNNVANSLMLLSAKCGLNFMLACPQGYTPDAELLQAAQAEAAVTGATITVTHNPEEAAADADAIYTDTWVSMGQEEEMAAREKAFMDFQVDCDLMKLAKPDCIVMHCLPAHRGQEVSSAVLDGDQSVIYDQAENRLHVQKAILSLVL